MHDCSKAFDWDVIAQNVEQFYLKLFVREAGNKFPLLEQTECGKAFGHAAPMRTIRYAGNAMIRNSSVQNGR